MIDLLIIFLLIVALWSGYRMGAVKLLGSMCGLLLALLACHLMGDQCAAIAMRWLPNPVEAAIVAYTCLVSTSPSPRDISGARLPASA